MKRSIPVGGSRLKSVLAVFAVCLCINSLSARLTNPWSVSGTEFNTWYEFEPTGTSAPGEIGLANWLDPILNTNGRVTRSGDSLRYNGSGIRFWGANISSNEFDMPHAEAEDLADFYAKYGVNLVRFHKFMEQWSPIATDSSWVDLDGSGEGLDRFDYLFAELKERGVFVNLSPSWHFTIKNGDRSRVPYWREFYDSYTRGSPVFAQVIKDNKATKYSGGTFSFDVMNTGNGISVGGKVYGVNGDFNLDMSKETAPIPVDASDSVTYLGGVSVTGSVTTMQPRSTSINFGSGYDYLVVVFWSNGFMEGREQRVDNVYLGKSSNRVVNGNFSDVANNKYFVSDSLRTSIKDNQGKDSLYLGRWHLFKEISVWYQPKTQGNTTIDYMLADGGSLDHPDRPHVKTVSGFGSPPGFVYFLDEFEDMKVDQLKNLLAHRNPYTGKSYAQDPAVAFVEMLNETSVGWWQDSYLGNEWMSTLRERVCLDFCNWLRQLPGVDNHADLVDRWGSDAFDLGASFPDKPTTAFREKGFPNQNLNSNNIPPWAPNDYQWRRVAKYRQRGIDTFNYLHQRQQEFYQRFRNAIKNQGVAASKYPGLLIAGNWKWASNTTHYLNLHTDQDIGVIDRHDYAASDRMSLLDYPGSGQLQTMSNSQTNNQPSMFSEWARKWWHPSTLEGRMIAAAYGMGLQGWDAMTHFPGPTDFSDPNPFPDAMDYEHNFINPGVVPSQAFIARQILRGDVSEGSGTIVQRKVHLDSILNPTLLQPSPNVDMDYNLGFVDEEITYDDVTRYRALSDDQSEILIPEEAPAMAKMQVVFTGSKQPTAQYDFSQLIYSQAGNTVYESETGELFWHVGPNTYDSHVRVDTARTQGTVGYFDQNNVIDLGDIEIKILDRNQFAAIYVTSANKGGTIANSDKLLVMAVGRARNGGMQYDGNKRLTEGGSGPVKMEPVRASIRFKRGGDPVVTRLDHDGIRMASGNVSVSNATLQINGVNHKTPYYVVEFGAGGGNPVDEVILDNVAADGFVNNGFWDQTWGDYLGANWNAITANTSRTQTAQWNLSGFNGSYTIYYRASGGDRASNQKVQIIHAGGTANRTIDLSVANGTWVPVGTFNLNSSSVVKALANFTPTGGKRAIADAIKLVGEGGGSDPGDDPGDDPVDSGPGSESFSSMNQASIGNGSFIGDAGFQWSYTNAAHKDNGISGRSWRSKWGGSTLSASIPGGLTQLRFKFMNSSTSGTAANYGIYVEVNGSPVAGSPFILGQMDQARTVTITLPGTGSSTNVEFINKEKLTLIDDISWEGGTAGSNNNDSDNTDQGGSGGFTETFTGVNLGGGYWTKNNGVSSTMVFTGVEGLPWTAYRCMNGPDGSAQLQYSGEGSLQVRLDRSVSSVSFKFRPEYGSGTKVAVKKNGTIVQSTTMNTDSSGYATFSVPNLNAASDDTVEFAVSSDSKNAAILDDIQFE